MTKLFIAQVRDRHPDLLISVDTWRHEVAEAVCAAGAGLLNDTWAGADPLVAEVAARFDVGLVCSHTGVDRPSSGSLTATLVAVIVPTLRTVNVYVSVSSSWAWGAIWLAMSSVSRSCRSTVTRGRVTRKRASTSGMNSVTAVVLASTRSWPLSSPSPVSSSRIAATCARISRAWRSRVSPASVSVTPRLPRTSSGCAKPASIALIRAEAAGGDRKARRAPAVRFPASATCTNSQFAGFIDRDQVFGIDGGAVIIVRLGHRNILLNDAGLRTRRGDPFQKRIVEPEAARVEWARKSASRRPRSSA